MIEKGWFGRRKSEVRFFAKGGAEEFLCGCFVVGRGRVIVGIICADDGEAEWVVGVGIGIGIGIAVVMRSCWIGFVGICYGGRCLMHDEWMEGWVGM